MGEGAVKCATADCSNIPDPNDPNTLYEIRGWERIREQGGQNHVIDRRRTGELLCSECATRLRLGLNPNQIALT